MDDNASESREKQIKEINETSMRNASEKHRKCIRNASVITYTSENHFEMHEECLRYACETHAEKHVMYMENA
jgi:hypothetical protein